MTKVTNISKNVSHITILHQPRSILLSHNFVNYFIFYNILYLYLALKISTTGIFIKFYPKIFNPPFCNCNHEDEYLTL